MKKIVIGYGLAMAALVAVLKLIEYHYFVRSLSMEVYMGIIATLFTGLGIWIGLKVTNRPPATVVLQEIAPETPAAAAPQVIQTASPIGEPDSGISASLGISNRELEVLALMAQGLSNQEIADQLFVSLNTIKTHSSNLYSKLEVKRRTQAIQKAKELNIIS